MAGLQSGDEIISMNGEQVMSLSLSVFPSVF
jgi:predicted metalloprotease with PDZ domain